MRVGLYTGHIYSDGQIGTGTSKYAYYLLQELRRLGVEVVQLRKGDNPADVDVIHDPQVPWSAPLFPRRPLVVTIQDLAPITYPEYTTGWIRWLFTTKLRWFVRRASRIIVPSRRTSKVLADSLRPQQPVDLIYHGVEERFVPSREPPADPPYLAQVGVHRRIKQPEVTLRAFEAIAARIPHELHFIGQPNPLVEALRREVEANAVLASRVRFYWPGEDRIPSVYSRSSLVVHPCPEEGFGFVPLEALASGAHVLARAPAVREILGPYGCYFDDAQSLPGKILECLSNGPPGTLADRSAHARQFTFRRMAEQTIATYER